MKPENGTRQGGAPIPITSAEAVEYLRLHGGDAASTALVRGDLDTALIEEERRRAREDLDRAATESSLTLSAAAEALGLTRSGVMHRINAGRLYAFTVGRRRYLPRWQFQPAADEGRIEPVAGLERILAAVPADIHPLAVQNVMTTRLGEFDEASPIGHLRDGGDPETVVDWLTSMGRDF